MEIAKFEVGGKYFTGCGPIEIVKMTDKSIWYRRYNHRDRAVKRSKKRVNDEYEFAFTDLDYELLAKNIYTNEMEHEDLERESKYIDSIIPDLMALSLEAVCIMYGLEKADVNKIKRELKNK